MNNRSDRTPYNYKLLLNDFRQYSQKIFDDKALTCKQMYKVIRHEIDAGIEVFPEYDWSNKRILIFQGPIKWKKIWLNTYNSFNVGPIRDILYKLIHNCLPTKVRIKKTETKKLRGGRFCTKCSTCTKVDERTLHVFAQCKHACNVWNTYKAIYTTLLPNKPYIYEHNALTINLQHNIPKHTRKLLLTLTEIIVNELWASRDNCYKHKVQPSIIRSKNRINHAVTKLIQTHYRYHKYRNSLPTFANNFTMDQALCSLDCNDDLLLNLPP